jgi:hypothetical protein
MRAQDCLPSCHSFQRLDAAVRVAFAVQQALVCVRDLLALPTQVAQRACAYLLRLQRDPLRLTQPARGPVEAVGAGQQLLALLELRICVGIVRVSRAKQLAAVVGVRLELALGRVEVLLEVAEARIEFGLQVGGNIGLFQAHLANLLYRQYARVYRVRASAMRRTSSSASSSALSALLIAALRGSPVVSLICSSCWLRSAWTSFSSAS